LSDVLTLAAVGSVDLASGALKGYVAARPFGVARSLLEKAPLVGKKVADLQDKLLSTYFTVGGKVGKPEVKAVPLKPIKEGSRKALGRLGDLIKPK
jgi:hypothetical protein